MKIGVAGEDLMWVRRTVRMGLEHRLLQRQQCDQGILSLKTCHADTDVGKLMWESGLLTFLTECLLFVQEIVDGAQTQAVTATGV